MNLDDYKTPFLFSIAMLSQIENISVTRLKRQKNTMINGGSRKQLSLQYQWKLQQKQGIYAKNTDKQH